LIQLFNIELRITTWQPYETFLKFRFEGCNSSYYHKHIDNIIRVTGKA